MLAPPSDAGADQDRLICPVAPVADKFCGALGNELDRVVNDRTDPNAVPAESEAIAQ